MNLTFLVQPRNFAPLFWIAKVNYTVHKSPLLVHSIVDYPFYFVRVVLNVFYRSTTLGYKITLKFSKLSS